MNKKARLTIYVDEETKQGIKRVAARRAVSISAYCTSAIKARLAQERPNLTLAERKALVARMDALRTKIGPIGITTAELVREGRRLAGQAE